MNSRTSGALTALAIVLTLGCSAGPKVRSDYDRSADFGSYHTFNFVTTPGTEKVGYSTLVTQHIETAVTEQMQSRGYQRSDTPDLLVNFSGRLQEKQEVQSAPGPAYYGYRTYGAWAGYGGSVYTVNYTEGTLNIDVIDARRMQMVWEGVGIGEVSQKDLENQQAAIRKAVADVFSRYPFRAGQAQLIEIASK